MLKELQLVQEREGRAVTSSRQVAEVFGKRHDNVLQAIQELETSAEFNLLNFQAVTYEDTKGESRPEILITRDGLSFLVMGFRGAKAAKFKEAYIAAFNAMEAKLRSLVPDRVVDPILKPLYAILDAMAAQNTRIAKLEDVSGDSRLTAEQVTTLNDLLRKRARSFNDKARFLSILQGSLKREFLRGEYVQGVTWKDAPASAYNDMVNFINAFKFRDLLFAGAYNA